MNDRVCLSLRGKFWFTAKRPCILREVSNEHSSRSVARGATRGRFQLFSCSAAGTYTFPRSPVFSAFGNSFPISRVGRGRFSYQRLSRKRTFVLMVQPICELIQERGEAWRLKIPGNALRLRLVGKSATGCLSFIDSPEAVGAKMPGPEA